MAGANTLAYYNYGCKKSFILQAPGFPKDLHLLRPQTNGAPAINYYYTSDQKARAFLTCKIFQTGLTLVDNVILYLYHCHNIRKYLLAKNNLVYSVNINFSTLLIKKLERFSLTKYFHLAEHL